MIYLCADVQTVYRHIANVNIDQFQLFNVYGICRFSDEPKVYRRNALY